jgi:hypothetical protein
MRSSAGSARSPTSCAAPAPAPEYKGVRCNDASFSNALPPGFGGMAFNAIEHI